MKKIKKRVFPILLFFLIVVGFYFRWHGLSQNYSFWTDEEHVAIFARAILERGKPVLANSYSTGVYQWLQYWLSAISAKTFGLNEFAIRFPSVIFGVLTIWAVYLLGKELFNKNVGLLSAFLITFSKIEILWSRQARPYQALQLFLILGAYFSYKLVKEKFNYFNLVGFLISGILAFLFHGLGLVVIFDGIVFLTLVNFKKLAKILIPLVVFLLMMIVVFWQSIGRAINIFGKTNYLFYYRVFLTHNYLLLCLLAVFGGFLLFWRKNCRELILFVIFLGVQIIIASFFLIQPFTRYFYPVFPFLILLSAFALFEISQYLGSLIKRPKYLVLIIQYLILFALVFPVVTLGHKFAFLPQPVYSLNADMQEIPEVDWKKVYNFVGKKLRENPKSILITNWNDLPVWYLGEGKLNYLLRKNNPFDQDPLSGSKLIHDLTGFNKTVQEEKKGLIIIDSWDNYIPDGIREYVKKNLKKEFEIDRLYPVQPRLWPVEVYSWGNLK